MCQKTRISRVLFLASFCLLSVPARAQQKAPPKPRTIEELQKAIQAVLTRTHVPGAGVSLIARDRIIWAGGVGKADVAANKPVTAATVFRVGSISKGFVALAMLELEEAGKIDLNAQVRDLAPEIPLSNPWEATHPVRVVNLLEHTAGFDDMHFNSIYNLYDPADIPLREVFIRFPKSQVVRWPPGTRFSYSNPGYGLTGYLIEKVTGRRFEDYIQEEILAPLGMKNSSFRLADDVRARLAQGYEGNPPRPVPYLNIYFRPAGNLISSPTDMALFVQMMLNRGQAGGGTIVRPESISRMETPETTDARRAGLTAGYGFAVFTDLEHPFKAYGHDGGIDGFISDYRYIPEAGRGYVVLLNSSSSGAAMEDITRLVYDFLTADVPKPKPPVGKMPEDALRDFPGYYQPANPRNEVFRFLELLLNGKTVFAKNGKLYMKGLLELKGTELIPVRDHQFRTEKQADAGWIFCQDEAGNPLLADGFFFYGQRTKALWPEARLFLILVCVLAMGSSAVFAPIWIALKIVWRIRGVTPKKVLPVRLLATPLLGVLSLLAAFIFINSLGGQMIGTLNFKTVGFCAATWAFAVFSAAGLLISLGSIRPEINRFARIHSLVVSLACCALAWYLAYWHVLGLQLWAF